MPNPLPGTPSSLKNSLGHHSKKKKNTGEAFWLLGEPLFALLPPLGIRYFQLKRDANVLIMGRFFRNQDKPYMMGSTNAAHIWRHGVQK